LCLINSQLQLQFIDEQLHTVAIFVEEAEGLPELLDLLLRQLLLHLVHSLLLLDRSNGLLIDLLIPLEKTHDRWTTTRCVPSIANSQATMDAD